MHKSDSLIALVPGILYQVEVFFDGRFEMLQMSPQGEDFFGCTIEKLNENRFLLGLVHPDDLATIQKLIAQKVLEKHEQNSRLRFRSKNNQYVWLQLKVKCVEQKANSKVWYGIATEIHDFITPPFQKRQDEQSFQELVEKISPQFTWIYDLENQRNLYSNKNIFSILGYTHSEILAMGSELLERIIHPDDLPRLLASQTQYNLLKKDDVFEFIYRMRAKNGDYIWVEDHSTVYLRDEFGNVKLIIGVTINIDSYKKVASQLEKTMEQWKFSLDSADLGTFIWNGTNNKLTWDEQAFRLHGLEYQPDVDAYECFQNCLLEPSLEQLGNEINSKLESNPQYVVTYKIKCNGGPRVIQIFGKVFAKEEMIFLSGVVKDITQHIEIQKILEQQQAQLVHNSKMAVLGQMASGIAHEINNPLAVIQARAFQISQVLESGDLSADKLKNYSDVIVDTSDRIAKIVKSLKSFSRNGSRDPFVSTPVKDVLDSTMDLCRSRTLSKKIQIKIEPFSEELKIVCRPIAIDQVLLNLINNSIDAIRKLENPWVQIQVVDLSQSIQIRVIDCGNGIKNEVAEKMMEPFFTTKPYGQGTGLGLSISLGIMKDHHGKLFYVEDQPHTTMVMEFNKNFSGE